MFVEWKIADYHAGTWMESSGATGKGQKGTNLNETETNKKLWEELIAYFPLIRHPPQSRQK
jgi:hypothetical protein